MPHTCFLVFAHVHNVYQNFGTCTYGDFMVIVETSGCDLKLLKVTENNLQVCIDEHYMNMSKITNKTLSTKIYTLIHY